MQQNERSRMLGEMPMTQLVPKVSIPIMVSMLVQALYNVVDSIFVAKHNPDALTAVSLAYPFQMLMIALGVGMATGISSVISRRLGEKNTTEARTAAWNGLLIMLCSYTLFLLSGLFLARPFLGLVASDSLQNAEGIRAMGTTYLRIVTMGSLGLFMSVSMERFLQSTGSTVLSMITQLSGALTNIVLDPILIRGYLFFPEMGVAGAAVATVIGQWVSMFVGLALNQLRNPELRLRLRDFRVSPAALRAIFAVGLPSAIMQAIGSVMNVGLNGILSGFPESNAAVNVLNVYFKLQSFVFMPVFGLGTGMIAIVGYNYGARNRERVYRAIRVVLTWAVSILAAGTLIFQLFPEPLMSLFESSSADAAAAEVTAAMTRLGVTALRTISWHFMLAAVAIVLSNVFQAVGSGVYSLIMSLCRQLLVLLPVALLLKAVFGTVDAVWWAFVAAETVSLTLGLTFFRRLKRTKLDTL